MATVTSPDTAERDSSAEQPPRRRRRPVTAVSRGVWPLVVPAVVVSAILVIAPVAYTIWLSVSAGTPGGANAGFVGLENFARTLQEPLFWNSLRVTLFLFVTCLIIETILGLALGYLLSIDVRGRRVFQGVMLIPAITAQVAVALVWLLLYDPSLGAINQFLGQIGIEPLAWLGDPQVAPWAIVMVDVWQWTPFMALIISAGIRSLPTDPFEAASIDGASGWKKVRHVGLPLLLPVLTVAMLLRSVDLIRFFDTVFVMTQGGPVHATDTLNVHAYRAAFIQQDVSYAATLQLTLMAFVILVAALFTWLRSRSPNER